jgi:hypothetical protein
MRRSGCSFWNVDISPWVYFPSQLHAVVFLSCCSGHNSDCNSTNQHHLQLLVPAILKKEVVYSCHDTVYSGHLGVQKTKDRIKQECTWYLLDKDVRMHIKTCPVFNKKKDPTKAGTSSCKWCWSVEFFNHFWYMTPLWRTMFSQFSQYLRTAGLRLAAASLSDLWPWSSHFWRMRRSGSSFWNVDISPLVYFPSQLHAVYNFEIHLRAGIKHNNADALSRVNYTTKLCIHQQNEEFDASCESCKNSVYELHDLFWG